MKLQVLRGVQHDVHTFVSSCSTGATGCGPSRSVRTGRPRQNRGRRIQLEQGPGAAVVSTALMTRPAPRRRRRRTGWRPQGPARVGDGDTLRYSAGEQAGGRRQPRSGRPAADAGTEDTSSSGRSSRRGWPSSVTWNAGTPIVPLGPRGRSAPDPGAGRHPPAGGRHVRSLRRAASSVNVSAVRQGGPVGPSRHTCTCSDSGGRRKLRGHGPCPLRSPGDPGPAAVGSLSAFLAYRLADSQLQCREQRRGYEQRRRLSATVAAGARKVVLQHRSLNNTGNAGHPRPACHRTPTRWRPISTASAGTTTGRS